MDTSLLVTAVCVALCGPAALPGETPARDTVSLVPSDSSARIEQRRTPLFSRTDALVLGGVVASTVAIRPFDRPISNEFIEPNWEHHRRLHQVAADVAFLGGDGPFLASTVLLAGTTLTGQPGLRQFAAHNIESIALATIITGIGKGITGRALPGVQTRHEFQFGRGFHDANGPFVSFPSGHTAAAFAMAATITGEWRTADPSRARLVEFVAFGGATAVGVARVAQRMHWPSDLPMAAFIGTWSGRAVQRHARDGGRMGTLLRGLTVGREPGGGTAIGWSSAR